MTEDLSLNNPANLNPPINPNSPPPIEQKREYPKLPVQVIGMPNRIIEREKVIDKYNSDPKRDKDKCFLGDSTKENKIGKSKYRLLVFLSVLGVLALILGGLGAGLIGYSAYTGKLNPVVSSVCAPVVNVTVQEKACANTCNPTIITNSTCLPAIVNVYLNSSG